MSKPSDDQPPCTITPAIVNLLAEIGESIDRYSVLAEQTLTPQTGSPPKGRPPRVRSDPRR